MSLNDEIQQLVETGASVNIIKAALIEDRTKELIRQRKELLQWAMRRLESLEKTFDGIKPDDKTYDGNGVCVERYSEKQFKLKEETAKSIKTLKDALDRYDWDSLKKLRSAESYTSKSYWNKNNDYFLSCDWSNYMMKSPFVLIDSF